MAGTCIQTIITQKGSSDGTGTSAASASVTSSNSTVSSAEPGSTVSAAAGRNSGTSGTGSNRSILTKFTDAVGGAADKIESAAGEINGTDCSAVLAEWLKSMLPSAVSTVSGKIYDTMFVISHCNYVGKAKSAVFTKQVCAFLADCCCDDPNWTVVEIKVKEGSLHTEYPDTGYEDEDDYEDDWDE